jgi:hypothetical protein
VCETAKGPCAIPFVVDFITYKSCTNLRSEYYWCSLTPHYGGDSKEPCPETCLSAGTRIPGMPGVRDGRSSDRFPVQRLRQLAR